MHVAEALAGRQGTELDKQDLWRDVKMRRPEERSQAGGTFSGLSKANSTA